MLFKSSSILDFPKPSLDPKLWNKQLQLRPEVRNFILEFLESFFAGVQLIHSKDWIKDIQFVGSNTTNTWNSRADVDIHLSVDLNKFIEVERPDLSEKEASDYLDSIRKQVDQVKAVIPNSEHPIELYFNTKYTSSVSTEWSGIFSVSSDEWLKYPHIVDQNFDIEKLYPELINIAKETASELDETFGDIKREVKDIKELSETIGDWPQGQRELFEKKLQKKLDDLEEEIGKVVAVREDVAEKRKNYKALSQQEITMKYLSKYFYMHVLTDLKTLLKQSPDLSMKDIPVVETIMQQANLKEAGFDSSYWIDPEGRSYAIDTSDNKTHRDWVGDNLEILMDRGLPETVDVQTMQDNMFSAGWARAIVATDALIFDRADLSRLYSLDDFIAKHWSPNKKEVIIDTGNAEPVIVSDPFPSLQEVVLKTASKQASSNVFEINGVRVYKNPTFEQAENLWEATGKIGSRHLRWAISPETNELFIWDAFNAHHTQMMEGLGIEPSKENYEDYAGDIVEFDDLDSVYQQWENKPITASLKLAYQEDENRILVDMDDTICHETPDHRLGEPMEGVKEALTKLKEQGFEIIIYSHRADSEKGSDEIKEYLDSHEIPYDSIFQGIKPLGKYYIDDRAIHFDNWNSVLKHINKSASLTQKYWIDPQGRAFIIDPRKESHPSWIKENLSELSRCGIDISSKDTMEISKQMFNAGWVRITDTEETDNADFGIELKDLTHIPGFLDNFVATYYEDGTIELDDQNKKFVTIDDPFPSLQKAVNKELRQPVTAALSLPIIDPRIFNREEPYALFIGTQWYSKTVGMDLFDVFGKHPMITEHNQVPTVTLETLQKENIPVIGKEPRVGNKEPIQDLSGVFKQAQLSSKYDFSSTHFLLPKEVAQKLLEWNVQNIPNKELFEDTEDPKGRQLEPHVTVKYGLLTDSFDDVKKVLEKEKAPHIKFGNTSFFEPEGKDYDVIIVEIDSKDIEDLSEKICSQLECNDAHAEFHPHATLAYVQRGLGKGYAGKDILNGEELDLSELTFSPKNGEKRTLELKSTKKESSFMPSNTDLAPSNNWSGDFGWPGDKEMDAPQNVSDEETWNSPENDRPRSKNFLKRMLSLFQNPLSKKEPKDVVPVKEASSNVFMLDTDTGLQTKALKDPTPAQAENLFNSARGEIKMLRWVSDVNGHLYMWDAYQLIHWDAMKQIPVDFGSDANTGTVYSADQAGKWAGRFQKDWEERRRESPNIVFTSKQAKQWQTPTEPINQPGMDWQWADYIYQYVGEMWKDLLAGWLELDPNNYVKPAILIESIYEDEGHIKAVVHVSFINKAAVEDAFIKFELEADVMHEPSVEPEGIETNTWLDNWEINVLDYGKSDELEKTSSVEKLVSIGRYDDADILVPEELLNKYIATISAHYKGLNKQEAYEMDLERSYLHKQLINYVLKNTLSGGLDVKYDKDVTFSIDQLISDFAEDVAHKENYPKETEKESSYGPTNYKGPSVADHGYQNSAWDDMNVTYSPQEDEELMDQNGDSGFPNRWMSRHRGPYYTNEGKVVKMLEDTTPQKQAASGNISGWLALDGQFYDIKKEHSHDGWIFKNWDILTKRYGIIEPNKDFVDPNVDWLISKGFVRVDGILPNELDIQVADINNIPQSAERFVWKYKPEVVIVEDLKGEATSFDKEEYSKGLMKQAAISGKAVNDILHLIQTTGGATYNFQKGNLVGTPAYAVAIYPNLEEIIPEVDYDTIEGYVTKNEGLLNNPNNSFGAWVSNGKTYLDIVAIVSDVNEAIKLGVEHKQLAIFDLKNLVEIPLQTTASLNKKSDTGAYWIDPSGKFYDVKITHSDWIDKNYKMLHEKYGFTADPEFIDDAFQVVDQLVSDGWVRIGDMSKGNFFGAEVGDIYNIPEFVFDYAAKQNSNYRVTIEDTSGDWAELTWGELAQGQKAVNKALQQKRMGKQAAVYSDREMQKEYDRVFSERWPDDSHPIDGGNTYYDFAEGGSNDYPNPKDEEKEHVYMDLLDDPAKANFPAGLPEYTVVFYDSNPDTGDQGGI